MTCGPVREAIGVFRGEASLGAVGALPMSGFDGFEISVPVGRRPVARAFGAAADPAAVSACPPEASTASVGNDARTPAQAAIVAGLGTLGAMAAVTAVISSGGTAAATGAGIAGILGGLAGAIALARDRRHGEDVPQQLAFGGLRLWVRTLDRDRETPACHISKRLAARAVQVQEAGRAGRIFATA